MNLIYWDHYYNGVLLLNLAIVVGVLVSLKFFSAAIIHVNPTRELSVRDNPAFGISLAGATLAIAIMLGGAIYGSPENNLMHSLMAVAGLGLLGILLMTITRLIFTKVTLPAISLRAEILAGNKAVAIADAGNVIAAAIIVYVVMIWVPGYSIESMLALLGGYAISQIFLTALTVARIKVFAKVRQGDCLQTQLKQGNIAIGLRFAGQKIGTALAMSTAAHIVVYEEYSVLPILLAWMVASAIVVAVWEALCLVAQRIILPGMDLNHEVIQDKNIAVGVLQAVICISIGLLISQL
ncbi:MAG: DUF350 domain-containing protein [Micavibrio aeruginosavorus]|uniref:DUF350 domain-containing protein n=1 Tax=Micavibrio aeruginosavorus TaxID=349221 RepID=A0A7T5R4C1_9BACT|nr:MAG: DUF350 domain-containing protein [Micavibrio aeruginosavorus]